MMNTPLVLIVLDGWGYREETSHNAISAAKKPNWDFFWNNYPHMLLSSSGTDVGLPESQMGNSEVGHMNLGAGRVIYQDLGRIDHAISTGDFEKNPVLRNACLDAIKNQGDLHIMGLLSPGGVHSHENHFLAMLNLARDLEVPRVWVHAFLDGRDTPPQSAKASLEKLERECLILGNAWIASIAGRYYAMDRDKRWDRTQQVYAMLAEGKADYAYDTAQEALEAAYARGETDEFVKPTFIMSKGEAPEVIADNDVVVFMNFRADRARQLTRAFIEPNFDGFTRECVPLLSDFVSLTRYSDALETEVAFIPELPTQTFGECLEKAGLTQLRLAETEKYAHVTFFFSGGREAPFYGESRVLIPSPKVATYDLAPQMSAPLLTKELVEAIASRKFDVIIVNYANPDMVGHTGDMQAAIQAVEVIDTCLGEVYRAVLAVGGEILITADHGNVECMYDEHTHQPHTAHTNELVPLIYLGRQGHFKLHDTGVLADVAPTMLTLLGLPIPREMTGRVLLVKNH